jgi:hypothetical protein
MKLKLPIRHYAIASEMLNQLTIDNLAVNNLIVRQSTLQAFAELRKMLFDTALKNRHKSPDIAVYKSIPDSYALLFFSTYNGVTMTGFESVVIKTICKQIEQELFISGKYSLMINFEP